MESNYTQPVNLGNPVEHSIKEIAIKIRDLVRREINYQAENHKADAEPTFSEIEHLDAVEDDPRQRRPDISLAKEVLNDWTPKVGLEEGLQKTIEYFRRELERKTFDLIDAASFNNIDDVTLSSTND